MGALVYPLGHGGVPGLPWDPGGSPGLSVGSRWGAWSVCGVPVGTGLSVESRWGLVCVWGTGGGHGPSVGSHVGPWYVCWVLVGTMDSLWGPVGD